MEYEIVISDACLEEIEENCSYIEKVLKAEQASNRLREKIQKYFTKRKTNDKLKIKLKERK